MWIDVRVVLLSPVVCLFLKSVSGLPFGQKSIKLVVRGHGQTPDEVKAAGGIGARAFLSQVHDAAFTLRNHQNPEVLSAYVSTSTDLTIAETFAYIHSGYVYIIQPTPNFVDMRSSLGSLTMFPLEKEVAALGGILWQQIIGWCPSLKLCRGKSLESLLDSKSFVKNPDYDAKLSQYSASLEQRQLAGVKTDDPKWRKNSWTSFKPAASLSARAIAIDFMNRVGTAVGWTGSFPLVPRPLASDSGVEAQNQACKRNGVNCALNPDPATSVTDETIAGLTHIQEPSLLVRSLGFLQSARLMTDVINSTSQHLNNTITDKAVSDAAHRNLTLTVNKCGQLLLRIADVIVTDYEDVRHQTVELDSQLIKDVREQTVKLDGLLGAILGDDLAESLSQGVRALEEYVTHIEVVVLRHYVLSIFEGHSIYQELLLEFGKITDVKSAMDQWTRIAPLLGMSPESAVLDVFRDWLPPFKLAEDAVKEVAAKIEEAATELECSEERFLEFLRGVVAVPMRIVVGTLQRGFKSYVSGDPQQEATEPGTSETSKGSDSEPQSTLSPASNPSGMERKVAASLPSMQGPPSGTKQGTELQSNEETPAQQEICRCVFIALRRLKKGKRDPEEIWKLMLRCARNRSLALVGVDRSR